MLKYSVFDPFYGLQHVTLTASIMEPLEVSGSFEHVSPDADAKQPTTRIQVPDPETGELHFGTVIGAGLAGAQYLATVLMEDGPKAGQLVNVELTGHAEHPEQASLPFPSSLSEAA